ncbi:hypothetical protein F8S20_27880 [Nostoc sp. BAE]|nr:hypothetical protein [Nostoc commune BAE]
MNIAIASYKPVMVAIASPLKRCRLTTISPLSPRFHFVAASVTLPHQVAANDSFADPTPGSFK